ncbi:hypothetical protein SK128_000299, partial [Halocaridina rubra]
SEYHLQSTKSYSTYGPKREGPLTLKGEHQRKKKKTEKRGKACQERSWANKWPQDQWSKYVTYRFNRPKY